MRLVSALGISLSLHAVLAALPPGHLSLVANPDGPTIRQGRPAPLWVKLGPNTAKPVKAPRVDAISVASLKSEAASASALQDVPEPPILVDAAQGEPSEGNAAGGGFGIPEPYYFPAKEVSETARLVSDGVDLPPTLATLPDSGRMVILMLINEQGVVDRVKVETSELKPEMESAIRSQFLHARFSPAVKNGVAVKSRMRLEVIVQPLPAPGATTESAAKGN